MMSLTKVITVAVVALLVVGGVAVGIRKFTAPNTPQATTSPAAHPGGLAVGDRIQLTIFELAGPNRSTSLTPLVESDGKIGMPLVQPISIVGLSTSDAEAAVRKAYADANLIANADVTVTVLEPASGATTSRKPIKAGDFLSVRVWDLDGPNMETKKEITVSDQGEISMPQVQNIKIAGMLERDAAGAINKAYRDANLVFNMQVEVVHLPKR